MRQEWEGGAKGGVLCVLETTAAPILSVGSLNTLVRQHRPSRLTVHRCSTSSEGASPGVRIEQTQLVKAPREQVFQVWPDYEAYPSWDPVVFTRVTVVERGENTARLDEEVKFMGLRMRRTEKLVLTPPEKVEVNGSIPNATNTTVWTFEAVPEGTMLTAVLEIQFKGVLKLLQPIAEQQGRTALREWMRAFAHHVEAEQANP